MSTTTVGIMIFDQVEVLDFAGPFEVFSRTRLEPGIESRRSDHTAPFRVFTVAPERRPVRATGGLEVVPAFGFDDAPHVDLLVVPGGFGTRGLLRDTTCLEWIRARAEAAETVTSVCTGALLLAATGLLRGKRATTHWGALGLLADIDPSIDVVKERRVVADGIITSAGVSAGIDMALDVVESMLSRSVADETARYIEYARHSTG